MSRKPRLYKPGQSYYMSIGVNTCSAAFLDDSCYEFFIRRLLLRSKALGVRTHAYCLMPEEILCLFTANTPAGISSLLESLDKSYCEYLNLRFNRYLEKLICQVQAVAIQDNPSFLECQRYLETAPCRRLGIKHPGQYHWSSYNRHAFRDPVPGLSTHPAIRDAFRGGDASDYREFLANAYTTPRLRFLDSRLRLGKTMSSDLRMQRADRFQNRMS